MHHFFARVLEGALRPHVQLAGASWLLALFLLHLPASTRAQDLVDAGLELDAGASALPDAGMTDPLADASSALEVVAVDAPLLPPPEPAMPPSYDGVIEVTVRDLGVAEKMQQSTASVTVLDLSEGRRQSADLGELLARTQGVAVRRSGGLGSGERISLNGLEGERIRVFVDGLPIAASAFISGVANIPVNLIERVEIYRGVVPVRFGADALGGAINVVTKAPTRGVGGSASLELGSFGTTRATADAHRYDPKTGLLTRANGFFDDAKNDYPVRVNVANAQGEQTRITAYRKHDAYRAYGAGVDVGYLRRKWAERLVLKTFASAYDKQLQSNLVMSNPYGEVHYGGESYGSNLQYIQPLTESLKLEALFGYAHSRVDFVDKSKFVYDWFGQKIRPITRGGEIDPLGEPFDVLTRQHGMFGRLNLQWTLAPGQVLYLTAAPNFTIRKTRDRASLPTDFDAAGETRDLLTFVTGLEHAMSWWDERLDNSLFVKSYVFQSSADEPLESGLRRSRDQSRHRFGFGDGVRLHITSWFYTKVSYELATRLPSADELFGDGRRVSANLQLRPEYSHSTNLTLALHDLTSRIGTFSLQANGFDRHATDLISPPQLGGGASTAFAQYVNIGRARSTGFELVGGWQAPRNYLAINGNVTWQDFRNTSTTGMAAEYKGDRVPNVPYFFANLSGRTTLPEVIAKRDELSLTYYMRYVHGFYVGWESLGSGMYQSSKSQLDSQLSHSLSLTYLLMKGKKSYSVSLDALNLTNRALFDEFGAQRPGRGYYFKLTAEL